MEFKADEIEQNIDSQSEDKYHTKKNEMILRGKMEINQLYNKKTNLMQKTTTTRVLESVFLIWAIE